VACAVLRPGTPLRESTSRPVALCGSSDGRRGLRQRLGQRSPIRGWPGLREWIRPLRSRWRREQSGVPVRRGTALVGLVALAALALPSSAAAQDRDCSDFSSQREAQQFFESQGGLGSDPHRLDADNDGRPASRFRPRARGRGGATSCMNSCPGSRRRDASRGRCRRRGHATGTADMACVVVSASGSALPARPQRRAERGGGVMARSRTKAGIWRHSDVRGARGIPP
jgi:hypothetical protein